MNKRSFVLFGVLLLIATACDSDIPSHYRMLDGDVPFVAEPRTGDCRLPYASQIALLDAEDGSVLRTQEVPWAGFLRQTGEGFVVEHFTGNQPSGVVAFDDSLNMAYQSEFPGKLRVHADDGGIVPMPGNRLLLRGGKSNKRTSLVLIDASTGEAIWEIVTPSLFTSPVLAGGTVIASTFEDEVLGISVETEELWRTSVTSSLRGLAAQRDFVAYLPGVGRVALIDEAGASVGQWPVVGQVASVKLIDPSIALVETWVDGPRKLVVFDSESGTQLWSVWLNNDPSLGTVPIRTDNQQAVFAGLKESLRSVDLATGQRNWQAVQPEGSRIGLAIEGDSAYVAVRRGSFPRFSWHLTAIRPASDDVVAWEVDLPGHNRLEPTVIGSTVFVGGYLVEGRSGFDILADGQGWLHAYNRHTGDLLWQTTLRDSPTHLAQGANGYVVLTADPPIGCD